MRAMKKSDKIWKAYCRINEMMNDLICMSRRDELNKTGWMLIHKYVEAVQKEFLNDH